MPSRGSLIFLLASSLIPLWYYYYGIRPLYVGLLLNFHVLNKGWPYTIVEGTGVGILNILELNLAKSNMVWSFYFYIGVSFKIYSRERIWYGLQLWRFSFSLRRCSMKSLWAGSKMKVKSTIKRKMTTV